MTLTNSQLTKQSTSLITGERQKLSVSDAWLNGTNLTHAVKHHPKEIRMWLFTQVVDLVKTLDANKTLVTDDEMKFCCRSIIDEHPTITLDEVYKAFEMLKQGKFGKLYERLKTAEILDCLCKYEAIRSEEIERIKHNEKSEFFLISKSAEDMLEPLGLAKMFDKIERVETTTKKEGIGTRLKNKNGWD